MLQGMNAEVFGRAFAEAYNKAMATGYKAPGTSPSGTWIHGPGGILGSSAIDDQVISARITPRGLSRVLQVRPSVYTNPEYAFITGIAETAGQSEPSTECATCPSGVTESCIQTAQFGFLCRETRTLTPNQVVERINRGEINLTLLNDILGLTPNDIFQAVQTASYDTILQIATAWAMLEVGALMQAKLVPMVWQGNPANNVGTGYKEFPGLDLQVVTGLVDAYVGVACGSLDSDVKDFNYAMVNVQDANNNWMIIQWLEYLEAFIHFNADRTGMLPVEWAWCMRPELWYELTSFWPIAYLTTRGYAMPTGSNLNVDSTRVREMIDTMRRDEIINLNGREHRVILDDGILELNNANDGNVPAGSFASSIYMIPLRGGPTGMDLTYFESKDYRGATRDIQAARLQNEFWSDDGRFLWTKERAKWCYTLSAKIEPRILLRTPFLAGRLDHVMYSPRQHFRSPFQDSPYWVKGGVEERPLPSLYSPWNLPAQ